MGFVGEVLNNVSGIQYFYMFGLILFMLLFFVMLYRTIKIPKQDLVKFKTSILDSDESESKEIIK
jgi:high-affinity Fe2+/Pb2+ permease